MWSYSQLIDDSGSLGVRQVNALYGRPNGDGYPRRPQPEAGQRRASLKSRAPGGRASAASGCGRTGITRLRQLRRSTALRCGLREKRGMCCLRRGRNVSSTGRYIESDPMGLSGGSFSTIIGPDAFNWNICCDLASTLAHEADHLVGAFGRSEASSQELEKVCFNCPRDKR